jgi:hypothetical protein
MRTDGQTDMTNLTVAFRNFANAKIFMESYIFRHFTHPFNLQSQCRHCITASA